MATIVNDRDVALQASSSRFIDPKVTISAANNYFSKANNASTLTPNSISLVATATGYSAPTYYWEYAISTAADTWIAAGNTTNTLPITNTTYASLISSGSAIQYRLTISQSYWPTTVSYYTINYSKATNSGPVPTLSRDSLVLPTNSSDVVTYTSSGTDIRVSINGVYIPVGTGANTFDVTTSSTNITVGTASTATTSVTNDTKRFGDLSAMSAGSTTVGTVTYTIVARDVDSVATTFIKTQTITKAGVGASGTSGRTVALTTTNQAFSYTTAGDSPNPSSTTLTATAQNLLGTGYYEFLKWNGTTWVSMQASSTTNTYPYNPQAAYTSMPEQIRVDVRDGASTGTVITSDTMSMIGIKAGKDSITGFISNEAAAVATAFDGTGADYTNAGGTFNVYDGTINRTGNALVTYSVPSSSGLTISIASTGVYTITAMSSDNATATLRAVYGGITIDKIYSISRSKSGVAGTNAVTAAYTNDSLTVPLTSAGVATWTGSGGQFQVYDGNTLLTLSSTTQSTTTPSTSSQYVLDITSVSGNTLTEPTLSGTTTVTISDWAGTLNTATVYRITAYIKTVAGNNVILSRDVSISPSKAGTDSTAYWMVASVAAIQKSITNVYNPTSITFTGYSAAGANSPALYAGRFKIYENGSGTASYTSAADESSKTYTPSGTGVTSIKAEFYLSGGTTTKLDEQTTPMVFDGSTGAAAGSFRITNSAAIFRKDKANNITPNPNIILTTAYTGYTSPTYLWYKDGTTTGITTASYTVPSTDYTSSTTHTYQCVLTGTLNGVAGQTISDSIVIPRLDDGAVTPTVLLSNSNTTFSSTASSGYTGITFTSGACNITAYLGSTQLTYAATGANTFSAVLGTPSGITVTAGTGAGSTFPVNAPTAMSADSAYVDVTVTIRDAAGTALASTIVTRITYSLVRTGSAGSSGAMTYRMYASTTNSATVPTVQATTTDGTPPTGTNLITTWQITPVTLSGSQAQWQTDGRIVAGQAGVANNTSWGTPYLSYFKVANLAAITASMGALSVDSTLTMASTGSLFSSGKSTYASTTAGYWLGYDTVTSPANTYKLSIGDGTNYIKWDSTALTINGNIAGTSNVNITGTAKFNGAVNNTDTSLVNYALFANDNRGSPGGVYATSDSTTGYAFYGTQKNFNGYGAWFEHRIPSGTVYNGATLIGDYVHGASIGANYGDVWLFNGQIKFSTSAVGTSTDIRMLDTYYEGSWTPTFTNMGTQSVIVSNYVKIGKVVTFQLSVAFSATGNGSLQSFFTLPTVCSYTTSFSVYIFNLTASSNGGNFQAYASGGGSNVEITYAQLGGSGTTWANRLINGSQMHISGSYIADT